MEESKKNPLLYIFKVMYLFFGGYIVLFSSMDYLYGIFPLKDYVITLLITLGVGILLFRVNWDVVWRKYVRRR